MLLNLHPSIVSEIEQESHTDSYSKTKTIAEKLVLEANGEAFKDASGSLKTCAIRPAAIYGDGEQVEEAESHEV